MEELIRRIQELSTGTMTTEIHGPPRFGPNPDVAAVNKTFARPDAREFYARFDPQNVVIASLWGDLTLFPFAALEQEQAGYAFNAKTRAPEEEWPAGMLVFGECSADPLIINPAEAGEILFAMHGQGKWDPLPIAADLDGFLKTCIAWLDMERQRGEKLFNEDDELAEESWGLFVRLARDAGIPQHYIDNMAKLA